jgi:DUF1680 family protein
MVKIFFLTFIMISFSIFAGNINYVSNRPPLQENAYIQLPLGSIEPQGWLLEQLRLSASGMTGHLDEIWRDVGPDNGWLGGDGDAWERGPYWLDGLLPLAYILKDKVLIEKSQKWVEAALKSQREDGYFGPLPDSSRVFGDSRWERRQAWQEKAKMDWWPHMVMLKVMQQYYEATADKRVIDFMSKYFNYQLANLPTKPLDYWTHWARSRGGENLASIYWLYNHTGESFLLDLGKLVFEQTEDWTTEFTSGHPKDWHGVNTGMAIKQPAVWYQYSKDEKYLKAVKQGIHDLMKYHGQIEGLWSGDELLHGTDPTHGTEFCTVVEYMFSLETLLQITGDPEYLDILERLAYNALPAQSKADFTGRQYYQTPNQIACTMEWHNFTTKHGETESLFGLETGYGCCTANYHQGWPKFAASLWMATPDNGLAALIYAPSTVTAKVADGMVVTFTEKTDYPFDETISFILDKGKTSFFPLYLHIPAWCESATITINGTEYQKPLAGSITKIYRSWHKGDIVKLHLPMDIRISLWHEQSVGIERGPLVYALKLAEQWNKLEGDGPYATYEVVTSSPWNFGILREYAEYPDTTFQVKKSPVLPQPWMNQNAPIQIVAKGRKILAWQKYGGVTGPIPYSPYWGSIRSDEPIEEILLIPYGCTKLRISEFPVVR